MKVKGELLIQHGNKVFNPAVQEGITWTTERKGCPGELQFKVIKDKKLTISEGDAVRFKVNSKKVFFGFIFKLKRDKEDIISVTAYDQLRYFKNKDTYVYEKKTASQFLKMVAADYNLQTGTIENTGFKIPSRVEENTTLFDMVQNALDLTMQNQKYMYIMYDDFGKITLKGLDNMRLNLLIDEETGENFEYTSSIDDQTYNKIKLTYDNKKTGTREVYIAQSSKSINQWGVLQYFDTIEEGENGKAKANALLSLYNKKTRNLTIKNAFGDVRVRAGSMVVVMLDLGDVKVKNLMLVEKCKHEFKESEHFMTLTLRGGEFIA